MVLAETSGSEFMPRFLIGRYQPFSQKQDLGQELAIDIENAIITRNYRNKTL